MQSAPPTPTPPGGGAGPATLNAPAAAPDPRRLHAQREVRAHHRQRAWCEWEDFDRWPQRIADALDDPDGAAWPPFDLLGVPGITPTQQRACVQRWTRQRLDDSAAARTRCAEGFAPARPRAEGERLRIGYLSADFHDHATAHLLIESLEAHDRSRYALHAYSHGRPDAGPMRQRLHRAFEAFHDIAGLDDEAAARQVHADGIDILVDLKGFTAGSRSLLLAWRAAPIGVSFLGYPGSLGSGLADYLISDTYVTPEGSSGDYAEALACLPDSYQPHARATRPTGTPPSRAELGLPQDAVVLCCFNQAWKLTPEVFDVWCDLLRSSPASVLWLLEDDQAGGNLRQQALARGVLPHRLVFAPPSPQAQHLARLCQADLVLDTWPYNAHTTASDALAAGVPLITRTGSHFASRVAGSLLHAVGLPELICADTAAYQALALTLIENPARLADLRQRLAAQRPTAALFDVARYTRHLEALYDAMWARHAAGLRPAALGVGPEAPGEALYTAST